MPTFYHCKTTSNNCVLTYKKPCTSERPSIKIHPITFLFMSLLNTIVGRGLTITSQIWAHSYNVRQALRKQRIAPLHRPRAHAHTSNSMSIATRTTQKPSFLFLVPKYYDLTRSDNSATKKERSPRWKVFLLPTRHAPNGYDRTRYADKATGAESSEIICRRAAGKRASFERCAFKTSGQMRSCLFNGQALPSPPLLGSKNSSWRTKHRYFLRSTLILA